MCNFKYLCQFREIILTAKRTLPNVLSWLPLRRSFVQLLAVGLLVCERHNPGFQQLPDIECFGSFFGDHVKDLLCIWRPERFPVIFVHVMQLIADILKRDMLLAES